MAGKTTQEKERTAAAPADFESAEQKGLTAPKSTALASPYADEDLGAGFEGMTQDELQIPFLVILQANSPQVEDGNPKRIEEAKAGMLMNTVTRELYEGRTGIAFIPVHRTHQYIEWIPRDEGGGLVAIHAPEAEIVEAARQRAGGSRFADLVTEDGNDLQETYNVYGISVKDDGTTEYVVLAFASTQIKWYKQWMTRARSITVRDSQGHKKPLPLFAHRYRLRTKGDSNKKGRWQAWDINFDGKNALEARIPETDENFLAAKTFRDLVLSGAAQAAVTTAQREDATTESAEDRDRF